MTSLCGVFAALSKLAQEFSDFLKYYGFTETTQRNALQVLVSVLIAVTLHLINPVRTFFDGSSYWIAGENRLAACGGMAVPVPIRTLHNLRNLLVWTIV